MAQPQNNIQVAAPGFSGINTQESPIGLGLEWAYTADNCSIDRYGRISSRKGFRAMTALPEGTGGIGESSAETANEYTTESGFRHILFSGGSGGMWSQAEGGTATPVTGLVASNNNWDYASLSDQCFVAQEGEQVQYTADGVTFQAMAEQPQVVTEPNIIASGLGHLFVASSATNKSTVEWSVLSPQGGLGSVATSWSGGGGGSINVEEYWPTGSDTIEAIAVHNGFLLIFGRTSILSYAIPKGTGVENAGPEHMTLVDTIKNIGCVARDSVVNIGTDLMFLDSSGVRSLARTIQEKSMPLRDLSQNVRDTLVADIRNATGPIRAVYSPEEAAYILIIPNCCTGGADRTVAYVLDTRRPLQNGALRVTKWLGRGMSCAVRTNSGKLLIGRPGGLYEYTGGTDTSYLSSEEARRGISMTYTTLPQDFDQSSRIKLPKQLDIIAIGGSSFNLELSWYYDFTTKKNFKGLSYSTSVGGEWGVAEWGVDSWGESGGNIVTDSINLWGSGVNVFFSFSGVIIDEPLSIQELNIQALIGRIK